jgi:hypothetical protein
LIDVFGILLSEESRLNYPLKDRFLQETYRVSRTVDKRDTTERFIPTGKPFNDGRGRPLPSADEISTATVRQNLIQLRGYFTLL